MAKVNEAVDDNKADLKATYDAGMLNLQYILDNDVINLAEVNQALDALASNQKKIWTFIYNRIPK